MSKAGHRASAGGYENPVTRLGGIDGVLEFGERAGLARVGADLKDVGGGLRASGSGEENKSATTARMEARR